MRGRKVLQCLDKAFKDKALRKTIVYRVLGVASGFAISYAMFRTLETCLELTVIIEVFHSALYYVMERFWK